MRQVCIVDMKIKWGLPLQIEENASMTSLLSSPSFLLLSNSRSNSKGSPLAYYPIVFPSQMPRQDPSHLPDASDANCIRVAYCSCSQCKLMRSLSLKHLDGFVHSVPTIVKLDLVESTEVKAHNFARLNQHLAECQGL